MRAGKVILGFFAVLVLGALLVGGCAYSGYRSVISKDQTVQKTWADVDVVLTRRAELIPNFVSAVKGSAKHEEQTLTKVIEARNAASKATTPAEKLAAADSVSSAMRLAINVVNERYPDLKANASFRDLMVQLEGAENRISEMRKRYNDAVNDLNSDIRAFPGSMYASWAGVKPAEYFKASEGSREVPKVEF